MKENEIQNLILQYLQFQRGFFWRNNSTGIYDPTIKGFRKLPKYAIRGVSDILGIIPSDDDNCFGRFVAIEVKGPKGKVTKEQKDFLDIINVNGGLGFVARSIEDVKEKIKK